MDLLTSGSNWMLSSCKTGTGTSTSTQPRSTICCLNVLSRMLLRSTFAILLNAIDPPARLSPGLRNNQQRGTHAHKRRKTRCSREEGHGCLRCSQSRSAAGASTRTSHQLGCWAVAHEPLRTRPPRPNQRRGRTTTAVRCRRLRPPQVREEGSVRTMKGYSAHNIFTPDEVKVWRMATELVQGLPEDLKLRCHELARAVSTLVFLPSPPPLASVATVIRD